MAARRGRPSYNPDNNPWDPPLRDYAGQLLAALKEEQRRRRAAARVAAQVMTSGSSGARLRRF